VLVFVKTKHGANRLAQQLVREGVEADAIHGNKSQNARTRALAQFKAGEMRVLVATDIAARGLDIEALPHVVNFDLPHVAEDYVHRIGRTGRAGAEGDAISLVGHEDRPLLAAIEKLMNRKVEMKTLPGFEPGRHIASPHGNEQRPQRQQQRQPQRQQQRRPQQQNRGNGQSRRSQQHRPAQQAPDSAYEQQIIEARARMREEGEEIPVRPQQQRAAGGNGRGNGNGNAPGNGRGKRRGGRGRSNSHNPHAQREQAFREPADHSYHQPVPAQAVKVVHKPRRTLSGFVGALLGRKTEDQKEK
jgi:ATP-dependent RNA helicase RhlE